MAASAQIINPADPKTRWVFKTPQNDALMADAIAISMKANGIKTMGYIGFADAYGDGWLAEMRRSAQTAGIKIVAYDRLMRRTLLMQRMEQVLTPRELNLVQSYLGIGQPDAADDAAPLALADRP